MSAAGVQALRGPSPDAPNAELDELADSGWLVEADGPAWTMAETARSWLAGQADQTEPQTAETALDRLSAFLMHELAARSGNVDDVHGTEIVAAIRALAVTRPAESIALAHEAWRTLSTAPAVVCQGWWQELADVGEDAAIDAQLPAQFIDLLQESGTALANADEGFRADHQWRRAYALTDQDGDRKRSAELLLLIGRLRRAKQAFTYVPLHS